MSLLGMLSGSEGESLTCSRAGCSQDAEYKIELRNPKIHTPERVKVWLSCAEHADYLKNFLEARSFPIKFTKI